MDAVVEIVDRLGGVDYEVEYPVRADFGRGELLLEEGFQRLDGRSFLTYIRDRSVGGDIGRSRRQQQVLIAAFSQLKNKGSLSSLPALYRSLQDNLETNLSPAQVASLAMFGTRVEPEQIRTYVFPGSIQFAPQGEIDVSYVVIDEEARVELIREVFGAAVEQRAQIVLPGRRRDA
ncbi:MAG TPA: LCP family protein, partial [Bacillota bacterium]|nr:LCP family protein [Bacillota bacterium]